MLLEVVLESENSSDDLGSGHLTMVKKRVGRPIKMVTILARTPNLILKLVRSCVFTNQMITPTSPTVIRTRRLTAMRKDQGNRLRSDLHFFAMFISPHRILRYMSFISLEIIVRIEPSAKFHAI
jgi:hypothetical protein